MNKIKQEKGVTLLILTVIIIALMILAGVAMNLGSYSVDSTIDSKLEGELKMVQYAVFQQYAKYKTTQDIRYIADIGENYNNNISLFVSQNYSTINLVHTIQENEEAYKAYYLLNPDNLIEIGIQDSEYSYIVNYYTGEVMNFDKYVTSDGKPLYVKGTVSDEIAQSF